MKKKIKKRLKTITDEDIDYIARWKCPYCKKYNEDFFAEYEMEGNEIDCSFCKKITKIKEPK